MDLPRRVPTSSAGEYGWSTRSRNCPLGRVLSSRPRSIVGSMSRPTCPTTRRFDNVTVGQIWCRNQSITAIDVGVRALSCGGDPDTLCVELRHPLTCCRGQGYPTTFTGHSCATSGPRTAQHRRRSLFFAIGAYGRQQRGFPPQSTRRPSASRPSPGPPCSSSIFSRIPSLS